MCVCVCAYVLFFSSGTSAASADRKRCDLATYDPALTVTLDLKNCGLTSVPSSIARFGALEKLDISLNPELTDLPAALPPTLTTLFALGGGFVTIPPSVARLPNLRMLSFKSCKLHDLGVAALPSSLRWLILTDNRLVTLPPSLGTLTQIRKLMLSNNREPLQPLQPSLPHACLLLP